MFAVPVQVASSCVVPVQDARAWDRSTAVSTAPQAVATSAFELAGWVHRDACQSASAMLSEVAQVFAPSAPPSSSLMQVTSRWSRRPSASHWCGQAGNGSADQLNVHSSVAGQRRVVPGLNACKTSALFVSERFYVCPDAAMVKDRCHQKLASQI